MTMKINVSQVVDIKTQERVVCGSIEYDKSNENPNIMFIDENM